MIIEQRAIRNTKGAPFNKKRHQHIINNYIKTKILNITKTEKIDNNATELFSSMAFKSGFTLHKKNYDII